MSNSPYTVINTPEGVKFRLHPAGLPRRMVAFIIDALMLSAILSVLNQLSKIFSIFGDKFYWALVIALNFIAMIMFWIVFEWVWNGRTVGKRLLRLKVVDSRGLKLLPQQIILRNLLRSIDFLPLLYATAAICCFFDKHVRRLGDIAAGTMVIIDNIPSNPDLTGILPDKYNSLRDFPLESARLRDKVTPEEGNLLLTALRRRDQLTPQDRQELYSDLAEHFKNKTKLPEKALDGVSDENFLKNILDIIYI